MMIFFVFGCKFWRRSNQTHLQQIFTLENENYFGKHLKSISNLATYLIWTLQNEMFRYILPPHSISKLLVTNSLLLQQRGWFYICYKRRHTKVWSLNFHHHKNLS